MVNNLSDISFEPFHTDQYVKNVAKTYHAPVERPCTQCIPGLGVKNCYSHGCRSISELIPGPQFHVDPPGDAHDALFLRAPEKGDASEVAPPPGPRARRRARPTAQTPCPTTRRRTCSTRRGRSCFVLHTILRAVNRAFVHLAAVLKSHDENHARVSAVDDIMK